MKYNGATNTGKLNLFRVIFTLAGLIVFVFAAVSCSTPTTETPSVETSDVKQQTEDVIISGDPTSPDLSASTEDTAATTDFTASVQTAEANPADGSDPVETTISEIAENDGQETASRMVAADAATAGEGTIVGTVQKALGESPEPVKPAIDWPIYHSALVTIPRSYPITTAYMNSSKILNYIALEQPQEIPTPMIAERTGIPGILITSESTQVESTAPKQTTYANLETVSIVQSKSLQNITRKITPYKDRGSSAAPQLGFSFSPTHLHLNYLIITISAIILLILFFIFLRIIRSRKTQK